MPRKKQVIIEKAGKTGFCFGVKRAINTLEKVARERGGIETLGAVVHNQQVLQKLADIAVKVVNSIEDIQGDAVVTSSHGVSPDLEEKIRARHSEIISTTCGNVKRAQAAAQKLAESDFFVIVYGDAGHPEVKGILGWVKGQGLATTDEKAVAALDPLPRKLGILSQTTQVPAHFAEFVKKIVDLMLVVGGRSSANTNRIAELCAKVTETHLIETAADIKSTWLKGKKRIGVTSGASTAEETVDGVMHQLAKLTAGQP